MAYTLDLSAEETPSTSIQTLTDANKSYRLYLPRNCGAIAIQPSTTAIKVSYNGVEGSTLTAYHGQPADSMVEWPLFPGFDNRTVGDSFYVETVSAGATIAVSLLPRDGSYPA